MKLYHYTDANAVKAVLEHGKLWLSDIRYLNDHNEYKEGELIIRSVFENNYSSLANSKAQIIKTFIDSCFDDSKKSYTLIGSFSRGEDLLSQWRGYCPKSGGYALEFETGTLKNFGVPLQECIYDDVLKNKSAEDLFALAQKVILNPKGNKNKYFQTVWANIAKFKNSGFSEEQEIRAVIFKKANDKDVKFRVRDNLLIPYIEIPVPYDKLKAIWVGPCQNSEIATESINRFIKHLAQDTNHPLSKIVLPTIKSSKITYRG